MSTSTLVAPSLKNKKQKQNPQNIAPSSLPSYHIFICCRGIGSCDVSHSTILSKKVYLQMFLQWVIGLVLQRFWFKHYQYLTQTPIRYPAVMEIL